MARSVDKVNLPVVDDSEFAEVGTTYVKDPHAAYVIGAGYANSNLATHIRNHISRYRPGDRLLVYCFRGGKRSRVWADTLRNIGFDTDVLKGGWKAYRRWVMLCLDTLPPQFEYRVLAGLTGCGKTRLLHALERQGNQVLDLEGLASHRGSLLGALPDLPQPTQKAFDSALLAKLRTFDPGRPVWVEAESKKVGNPWGEALALLRTPSGQPFYLNLHSSPDGEDSGDQKLPGNTLIIGSTGVGKTTLEMFLLALTRKWDPAPRLVLFDVDRGCEIAMRALGGRYLSLEAGKPTGLNPLQAEPTPARLQFWEQWLRTCLDTPALPLLPADERAIAEAVRAVAMMPAPLRRMSTIRQNLPKAGENSLHERLGRWCRGGALGWVFDEAEDRLADLRADAVICFDTTEFLDLPEVRTPVMLYLLQLMEELVTGERLIYVISEFWKALDHPVFSDFAKQKQKTIRKQNGLGIFDTQSPSDVLNHPIGRTMVEQSVTKIFLANPDAVREEYVEGFGLNGAEFEMVRSLSVQGGRRFLVKQGHASAVCELDLSGLEDFVTVLSATTDNVALLDRVRERHGDDPFRWLPVLLREVHDRRSRSSRRGAVLCEGASVQLGLGRLPRRRDAHRRR